MHGSWLNRAEVEVSLVSRGCLGKLRVPSVEVLRARTRAWEKDANRRRVRIRWAFTVPKARRTFRYRPADVTQPKD